MSKRKRYREHQGTIADGVGVGVPNMVVRVVGHRPEHKPYLLIHDGSDAVTVDNPRALRSLAHHILRALGDEP
jgi:hypothetical protein